MPYPDYLSPLVDACAPPRCRLCADGLAELSDISVGDAWLDRFEGSDGVSDLIARSERGERLLAALTPDWLTLEEATPAEILHSQVAAYRSKRTLLRGRLRLRRLARRSAPAYPGLPLEGASPRELLLAAGDIARTTVLRLAGDLRYR